MDLILDYSSSEESQPDEPCRGSVTIVSIHEAPPFERRVPHIPGNWSGHVFSELDGGDWNEQTSVEQFRVALERAGWSGTVVAHTGLHISLSRPFFLQLASIASFQKELVDNLRHERSLVVKVQEHTILENDEGTRSFFVWKLFDHPGLQAIVTCIDDAMRKYKQPEYYHPPTFHVSLASIKGKVPNEAVMRQIRFYDQKEACHALINLSTITCTFGTTKRLDIAMRT